MQVSVETTLKWAAYWGGNKPGSPVTVTAESTESDKWLFPPPAPLESIWQAIMTQILSGWRINALLCQVFPVRKGAPLGPNASYKLRALFFFFLRDDLELRIRQNVAEMRSYRDVRRDSLVCTVTLESEREQKCFWVWCLWGCGGDISVYILCTSK